MKTKKIAKRLLVWALTLAMVVSMCSVFVSAATPQFKITATPAEVKAGDTVTVKVSCSKGIGFMNCGLNVFFDNNSFDFVSYKAGAGWNAAKDDAEENYDAEIAPTRGLAVNGKSYAWGYMSTDYPYSAEGDIFVLTFKAKDSITAGSYDFDLSFSKDSKDVDSTKLKDKDDKDITVTADTPATVKVAAQTVAVTGVKLDKTALTLTEGDTATLTATVEPSNATDKTVTWSTSNSAVATVSNGKVTAVKPGTATITVTTKDGSKKATCAVTVNAKPAIKAESVSIPATADLTIGGTQTIKATVTPAEAAGTVTWTTSDSSIATVSSTGKITAKGIGTATVNATVDGVKSNDCVVTVSGIAMKGITLTPASAEIIVGATKNLTVAFDPTNTTDDKTVTYSSADEAIAKVSSKGVVTGVAEGETTITATCGEFTATSTIKVVKAPVIAATGVKLDKSSVTMEEGKTETLKATVLPTNAENKNVSWSSSDEAIAKVDENGVVTAVAKGIATITVKTEDGDFTAQCRISVLTKDEYNEYDKTADATAYVIALALALISLTAMSVLIIAKKRQSVR